MPSLPESVPGQVSVSARALNKVVTAIAADLLRVGPKDVAVRLADDRGLLAVAVVAPVRVPPLGDSSFGVLERSRDAQAGIRDRTAELTGSTVRTVAVRLTRASILGESRVS